MSKKYLKDIPRTLQEDFIDNKVIPFVGAGFSKNGVLPKGVSIPDWNELGRQVSSYISDYEYVNALDALSLFESQYCRVKLVELLAKFLYVNDLKPGDTHRAFCKVFFNIICTTNYDFLLEHTLQESKRPHSLIVSEDRLPINTYEQTRVLKLHGDFNHPERMVITEKDYDTFLDNNKVLATYVSNLFITNTLFLVGYSFDDADIRGLWQIINNRLGQLHRPAYTVLVDASPIEISRFERRNIMAINLKGKKSDYPLILTQFFEEVKDMMDEKSPERITPTSEKAREELKLPSDNKRLCFISAPYARISILKEILYPILAEYDITPITLDEVIMPGDNWMAKSETLLRESSIAIVDVSGNNTNVMWELGLIKSLNKKLIIIADKDQPLSLPVSLENFRYYIYSINNDNEDFIMQLSKRLSTIIQTVNYAKEDEPTRLLKKREYDAAVIASYRLLESILRDYDNYFIEGSTILRPAPLSKMLKYLNNSNLPRDLVEKAIKYLSIRNQVVHASSSVEKNTAIDIVKTLTGLVQEIKNDGLHFENYSPSPNSKNR